MTNKKDFSTLSNPADEFLDNMNINTSQSNLKTEKRTARITNKAQESKSVHTSLLLTPSIANNIKMIAKLEGTSVNSIGSKLLEEYVAKYKSDPERAAKLKQALDLFS